MLRHPLDDALRTSEEPPRAAFLAGVTRLWLGPFTSQNENAGWIVPSRSARNAPGISALGILYGTTLRVYDPRSDLWHITWIDPLRQDYDRMTGRKVGDDIVQEYRMENGTRCQWLFTEITASSFHWIRRESKDNGENWNVRVEFFLRRRMTDSHA